MAKAFKPQIVTANDLFEGDVVYFTAGGFWSRLLSDAAVALSQDEADALLARGEAQQSTIVGAYLAEVALGADGHPQPQHYREKRRTLGPSNRPDLGRQAEQVAPAARAA